MGGVSWDQKRRKVNLYITQGVRGPCLYFTGHLGDLGNNKEKGVGKKRKQTQKEGGVRDSSGGWVKQVHQGHKGWGMYKDNLKKRSREDELGCSRGGERVTQ